MRRAGDIENRVLCGMSIEQLLIQFGLPFLFFGTMVEGEGLVLIAGFLAHRGYLPLVGVIAAATGGSFLADQLYYWLGATKGAAYATKRPALEKGLARVTPWLHRFGSWLVLGFRFLLGFRSAIAFAFGVSGYPFKRFALLNGVGALLWAAVTAGLGYVFGQAAEAWFGNLKQIELALAGALAAVLFVIWLVYRTRQTKSN